MEIGKRYKTFDNRIEAAELLIPLLEDLKGQNPLVLAIPRGAVPMARVLVNAIGGQMDVALVRKIRHPYHPEFAVGAVSEHGEIVMDRTEGLTPEELEEIAMEEVEYLKVRRRQYMQNKPSIDPHGRTVALIDDGIATGSTMAAAVRSLKAQGASKILVVAPVASQSAVRRLQAEGAETRILYIPEYFGAVSYFYNDFTQVSDAEVGEFFRVQSKEIEIEGLSAHLKASLGVPVAPRGVVIFAHASADARLNPRNQYVAEFLNRQGIATVLVDILTHDESLDRNYIYDLHMLCDRLKHLVQWVDHNAELSHLPLGLIGTSTGAAAAILAIAELGDRVSAFVSRSGRIELAKDSLDEIKCPTLLIAAGEDPLIVDLSHRFLKKIPAEKSLEIIRGATHLFQEPGALEQVADLTTLWFLKFFAQAQMTQLNIEPPIYP